MQSDIIKISCALNKVHRGLIAIGHPQNSGIALKAAAVAGVGLDSCVTQPTYRQLPGPRYPAPGQMCCP